MTKPEDWAKFQRELTAPPLPRKTYGRAKRASAATSQVEGKMFMDLLNFTQTRG